MEQKLYRDDFTVKYTGLYRFLRLMKYTVKLGTHTKPKVSYDSDGKPHYILNNVYVFLITRQTINKTCIMNIYFLSGNAKVIYTHKNKVYSRNQFV